jgi:DNA replication protein DnaC
MEAVEFAPMEQEKLNKLFPIKTIKTNCKKCGKEFEAVYFNAVFKNTVAQLYCDECVEQYDEAERRKQLKFEREIKEKAYLAMGIREEYFDAKFSKYKATTDSQKKALAVCKDVVDGNTNKLVFLGTNGVGKTMLMACIVKRLGGKMLSAYELYARYRECFVNPKKTEIALLEELTETPALVIDEFGRTKGSEAENNFLSEVVNRRTTSGKFLGFTSNLVKKSECIFNNNDYCSKCTRKDCLESWLSSDILSRLMDGAVVITISADDYRQTKRK